jgi:hypothetical protein
MPKDDPVRAQLLADAYANVSSALDVDPVYRTGKALQLRIRKLQARDDASLPPICAANPIFFKSFVQVRVRVGLDVSKFVATARPEVLANAHLAFMTDSSMPY